MTIYAMPEFRFVFFKVIMPYMQNDWPLSDLLQNPARGSQSLNNLSSSVVSVTMSNDKLSFQTKVEILRSYIGGIAEQPAHTAVNEDVIVWPET